MTKSFHLLAGAAALVLAPLFASAPASADTSVPTPHPPEAVGPRAAVPTGGADLHIHNKTGTDVELYIFEDDHVHRDKSGGLHAGDLHDGETGTAHVKACHFAVVLFHGKDAYHAEFHDCSITDITITAANKK